MSDAAQRHRRLEFHDPSNPDCRFSADPGVASPDADWCSCPIPEQPAARSYATANGFYLGDKVMLPDGRTGYIDEIVVPAFRMTLDGNEVYSNSVVRLDDELWSDGSLTRVG